MPRGAERNERVIAGCSSRLTPGVKVQVTVLGQHSRHPQVRQRLGVKSWANRTRANRTRRSLNRSGALPPEVCTGPPRVPSQRSHPPSSTATSEACWPTGKPGVAARPPRPRRCASLTVDRPPPRRHILLAWSRALPYAAVGMRRVRRHLQDRRTRDPSVRPVRRPDLAE